ncbi:MAG: hypothetical protein U0104_01670 [Gemmatimonadales bacterium]|nr:hypothetical protein [Gemmatimonadales bacterium]
MSGPEVLIPISFFVMVGLVFISRSEIGKAIAHAIRVNASDADDDLVLEMQALRTGLEDVRHQLAETQERLDFTERLLAQQRTPDQLPRG